MASEQIIGRSISNLANRASTRTETDQVLIAGGNETRTAYSASVLNEGILARKLPEIIIVLPNLDTPWLAC